MLANWKLILNIFIFLLGIIFSLPNFLGSQFLNLAPINLGLDLKGGSYMSFEANQFSFEKNLLESVLYDIQYILKKRQIKHNSFLLDRINNEVSFIIDSSISLDKIIEIIKSVDHNLNIDVSHYNNNDDSLKKIIKVSYTISSINNRLQDYLNRSIEIIRHRIDEFGTKDPSIFVQSKNQVGIQLPGIYNTEEAKRLIGKTARLTLHLIDEDYDTEEKINDLKNFSNINSIALPEIYSKNNNREVYYRAIRRIPLLTGEHLLDVQSSVNQYAQPCIILKFNKYGSKKFFDISKNFLGKKIAIVLDKVIINTPTLQEIIPDGNCQISGSFTIKQAEEIAILLRSGSLPLQLNIIEERIIGPSLGSDCIYYGIMAIIISIFLVIIFMISNYSLFGFFSGITLIVNLLYLIAFLTLSQATLTLPGIGGIALTVGMSVDSNVLIYERIKEELCNRQSILKNNDLIKEIIEISYRKALKTILDSNITTFIGAIALIEFGSGPVRGFAVTLIIGIITSLFCSFFLNKAIIFSWINIKKNKIEKLPI